MANTEEINVQNKNNNNSEKISGNEKIDEVPLYRKGKIIIPFFIILIAAAAGFTGILGS